MKKITILSLTLVFASAFLVGCGEEKIEKDVVDIVERETELETQVFQNTDETSPVEMVVLAPNNEAVVAFTNESDKVEQIGFQTAFGQVGMIQLDENQMPESMDFEGTKVIFKNYTSSTVDITVIRADGSTETFLESRITPANDLSAIITTAYADTEGVLSIISTGMNVIKCGVGLGSILFSSGAATPMAYISCGSLSRRFEINEAEMNQCEKISADCALKELAKLIDEKAPFLQKGILLKGEMKNSITGSLIKVGTLNAVSKNNSEEIRGEWNTDGNYEFYFRNGGAFDINTVSEGFADSTLSAAISNAKVQLWVPGKNEMFQQDVSGKDYDEVELDLYIDPAGFIRGEIIDSEEGMAIEDATVTLLNTNGEVDSMVTAEDGLFALEPPLNTEATSFTIKASASGYESASASFLVDYDIKEESDEYDITDWSGVIKMKPGAGYAIRINPSPKTECRSGPAYDVAYEIKDGKIEGYTICPPDLEGCSEWPLFGYVKNTNIEAAIDYALFGTIVLEGNIGPEGGTGTWFKGGWIEDGVIPDRPNYQYDPGEAHHAKDICEGTWTVIGL